MSQAWYYARGSQKQGPISAKDLRELATSGKLQPTDLVWTEGMAEWKAASSIKDLFPQEPSLAGPPPLPSGGRGSKTGDLREAGVRLLDRLKTAVAADSTTTADSSTRQGPTPTSIDDLPVSETWKQRFREIESHPEKQGFGTYNILAFFFGPFYYAAKGLWKKGLVLALAGMVLSTILERLLAAFGGSLPTQVQWMPAGALCATMANRDVYLKEIRGERFWPSLDRLERPIPLIAVTIASLYFVMLLSPSLAPENSGLISGSTAANEGGDRQSDDAEVVKAYQNGSQEYRSGYDAGSKLAATMEAGRGWDEDKMTEAEAIRFAQEAMDTESETGVSDPPADFQEGFIQGFRVHYR